MIGSLDCFSSHLIYVQRYSLQQLRALLVFIRNPLLALGWEWFSSGTPFAALGDFSLKPVLTSGLPFLLLKAIYCLLHKLCNFTVYLTCTLFLVDSNDLSDSNNKWQRLSLQRCLKGMTVLELTHLNIAATNFASFAKPFFWDLCKNYRLGTTNP